MGKGEVGEGPRLVVTGVGTFGKTLEEGVCVCACACARVYVCVRARVLVCAGLSFSFAL